MYNSFHPSQCRISFLKLIMEVASFMSSLSAFHKDLWINSRLRHVKNLPSVMLSMVPMYVCNYVTRIKLIPSRNPVGANLSCLISVL